MNDSESAGIGELPEWEDPRVQKVYEILCDDKLNTPPNPEEHWEGWVSRNIVAALCGSAAQPSAGIGEPVAYRVKDYGDSWILCHTQEEAVASADGQCMIQPLFLGAAQAAPDRAALIEECAKVEEAEKETFLSPEYASNQPFGSLCERFACDEVAKAIRALAVPSTEGK